MSRTIGVFVMMAGLASGQTPQIGNHAPRYDSRGILLPWTPWTDALDREMRWYQKCPIEHGYPRFVYLTFMDGDYKPVASLGGRTTSRRCRTAWGSSHT